MSLAHYLQKLRQQCQLQHLQQLQEGASSSNTEPGARFSQSCLIYPHQASEFGHILKEENPSSSPLSSIPISFLSPNPQEPTSPSALAPNLYSDFYRLQLNQSLTEQPERSSPVAEPVQQKISKTPEIENQQELSLVHRAPLHIKPYSTSENEATHANSIQAISRKAHSETEQTPYATTEKNFQPSEIQAMIAKYHETQRLGRKYKKLIKKSEQAFNKFVEGSLNNLEHSSIPELRTDCHLQRVKWSPTPYSEDPMESASKTREPELSSERDSRNCILNEPQAQASYLPKATSEIGGPTKSRSSIPSTTAAGSSIMSSPVSTNGFVPLFQTTAMQQSLMSPTPFLSGFPMNPNFATIEKVPDHADVIARALVISRGNQRKRGEKKPIPNDLKDGRYYERRKRNNAAAKKSRDARKAREREVASKATILETENSCLRNEVQRLKAQVEFVSNDLIRQGYPMLNLLKLATYNNVPSISSISNVPALSNLSNVASLNAYANLSNINMKNLSITNDGN